MSKRRARSLASPPYEELPEGYTIRITWISPMEGFEYRMSLMGHRDVLAYRKSWRAAVNAAWKHAGRPMTALPAPATEGAA